MSAWKKSLYRQPWYLWLSAVKSYNRNKAVFDSLLPLAGAVEYFSVAQQAVIPESEALTAVQRGDVLILRKLIDRLGLQQQFNQLVQDYFALDYASLSQIHQLQSVEDIVQNMQAARYSPLSLQVQSSIMRRLLQPHTDTMYLELQPNLRLHLPYSYVKGQEQFIEQKVGRGKLNPHGQHKDSWRGHPKNTINVWIALTEANDQNGMSILLNSLDYHPCHDAQGQEIMPHVRTYPSQHYVTDLQPGDAVMFRAELLHGSIINQDSHTRVALSMRCSVEKPQFHRNHRYNYIGLEKGRFNNLTIEKSFAKHWFIPESTQTSFAPAEAKGTSIRPDYVDEKRIELRDGDQTKVYPRYCPHAGADMLHGELNADGHLLCPSHRRCVKGKTKADL